MKILLLTRAASFAKNKRVVALVFCLLCTFLALPLSGFVDSLFGGEFFGIPSGYFYSVFAAPLVCIFLISLFIRFIEDIDRHDPELENE